MSGRLVKTIALCVAAVSGGVFGAAAADVYDRQLESWAKQVVARKIGDIRGTIEQEWRPIQPPIETAIVAPEIEPSTRVSAMINLPGMRNTSIPDSTSGRTISASIEAFGPLPDPVSDTPAKLPHGPPAYPLRVIPLHQNGG